MIILPGSPAFEETIAELQELQIIFNSDDEYNFIALPGHCGLLEVVSKKRSEEYLEDGEYETRLIEMNDI